MNTPLETAQKINGNSANCPHRKEKAERCRFCNKIISGTIGRHYNCKSHLCSRCIRLLNGRNMKGISQIIRKATLLAKKEEWQNEIEFLKTLGYTDFAHNSSYDKAVNRMSELKKAVELANG